MPFIMIVEPGLESRSADMMTLSIWSRSSQIMVLNLRPCEISVSMVVISSWLLIVWLLLLLMCSTMAIWMLGFAFNAIADGIAVSPQRKHMDVLDFDADSIFRRLFL